MGCPKPGSSYLDVITPGYRTTLSVDDQVYAVHEAREKAFVCKPAKPYRGTPRTKTPSGQS